MYNKVTKRKNHILIHFLSLAFVAWCIVVFIEARYAYDDRTMFEGIVISVSYLYPFPLLLSSFLFGRYQAITEHKNYFWVGQRVISYYFIVGSLISNWFFRLKNISISFEMVWILSLIHI